LGVERKIEGAGRKIFWVLLLASNELSS